MLKVHPVRGDGHRYYTVDLVPGRAEGSPVAGESPGVWSGGGAAALGLDGRVDAEAFHRVLDGVDPWSGARMRRLQGERAVSGFDLTFCAPKSVSVLHLLAPVELAAAVGVGHQAAVVEAADYLGRAAVGVRRRHQGQVAFLPSTGAVAGSFVHRTSRALDPHLHTHLVVANVAQGVDGTWSAVDSRRLFNHIGAAQALYHARLRLELRQRAGVEWEMPPTGLGDVVGVDRRLCRLFSQRSAAMDEYRFARNSGAGRSGGAFHATRPDKDRSVTVDALVTEWKGRAARFGFDLGELVRVVGGRDQTRVHPAIDRQQVRDGLHRLATRSGRTTVARPDVVALVAVAAPDGATAREVESVTTALIDGARPRSPAEMAGRERWPPGTERLALDALTRVADRGWPELGERPAPTPADVAPLAGRSRMGLSTGRGADRLGPDRDRSGPTLER